MGLSSPHLRSTMFPVSSPELRARHETLDSRPYQLYGVTSMKEQTVPKLDVLDRRILYELDRDAFQSLAKIGKRLHVKRDVMHYRVKQLERQKIILRYITIIDYSRLGLLIGGVYLKLQHDSPKMQQEILGYFKKEKRVWWVNSRDGNYDLGVGFWFKDIEEFKTVQTELLKKYNFYFREIKTRIFSSFQQFPRRYLAEGEENAAPVEMGSKAKKITDGQDDKILGILAGNARSTYVEIANALGMSAAQVHYRIRNLRSKKVILGARAVIDRAGMGYLWYKVDIYLDDYSAVGKICAFAAAHPNAVYQYDTVGGADVELEFEVRHEDELLRIIDSIKEKFSDAIRYTEFYRFTKEHKIVYFPGVGEGI